MPYTHSENIHNLNAPNQIVPLLIKIFNPTSVIDVGCGIGTFLSVFKDNGVKQLKSSLYFKLFIKSIQAKFNIIN